MSSERGNSHTNPEIGRSLERARAERGLSLWQVEEATKIRARYLRDLERENFDVLPAVYVLGSLKTYADYLGLDGEALARELKSRQESPPEERDPTPEEPAQTERGGFLAALGGLPLIGDRDAVGDDRGAAPAAVLGSRLYLVLGAVSILVLAIALTTILSGGDQPAVSQMREPAIPEAPSRIAFSGNAEDSKDDERDQVAENKDDRPGEQAESSDGGDEKGEKEDERDQVEKRDRDDTRPEDTGDVAVALPASISAASAASASASAASASATAPATSTPAATAPATSTPAATAPATSTPAATASASAPSAATVPAASAAPQTAEPGAAPRPVVAEPAAVDQPAPATVRAPAGPRRAGVADGTRPVKRIVGKVRIVRSFSR